VTVNHHAGQYEISFQTVSLPDGLLISDQNILAAHPQLFEGRQAIILEPGEQTKSLVAYGDLCRRLVESKATRKTTLIAFGGGVIGDLVGFVAATYMRGIPYVQIPTTLLAQVDSSVGGKTGIDLPEGKNLVGAFNPPNEVQIDTQLLTTLPPRQFTCGMAEVLKYGFIQNSSLAADLHQNQLKLGEERVQEVVKECVTIKARMVQEDEFETLGIRAQLNFGHTVGHALEQFTRYEKYTHGEAIAVGMVVETRIGELLGYTAKGTTEEVESLIRYYGLPTKAVELRNPDSIISTMRKDKKSSKGELSMSLIERVGICSLISDIDENVVKEALNEFAEA
jgi:3-dehydroquinate synthase